MKTVFIKIIDLVIPIVLITTLNSQNAHSQSTDSITHSSPSIGAIQFQLLGGLGLYYIGDWNSASHYRIGADFYLGHSNQSGGSVTYNINTAPGAQGPLYQTNTPDQTSNSYQISLSTLYLQQIIEYKHTSIYCGVGPVISYYWGRSNDRTTYYQAIPSDTTTAIYNNENTSKTSGIGPLIIIGLKSRVLDHISLTAEIGLSALYQWTMDSYSYNSTYYGPGSYASASTAGNISHLNGWDISLTDIRIGLAIEL